MGLPGCRVQLRAPPPSARARIEAQYRAHMDATTAATACKALDHVLKHVRDDDADGALLLEVEDAAFDAAFRANPTLSQTRCLLVCAADRRFALCADFIISWKPDRVKERWPYLMRQIRQNDWENRKISAPFARIVTLIT